MRTRKTIAGATLLAAGLALLSPRDARSFDSHLAQSSLKDAASRLRGLASEKGVIELPKTAGGKQCHDWKAQTTWLQKAADRCEALAQQMDQPDMKKLELSFQNLRKALLSESASNARQCPGVWTPEAKARQDKAAAIIQGLK